MKERNLLAVHFTILSISLAVSVRPTTAETRFHSETEWFIFADLDGEITKEDARRFERMSPKFAYKGLTVFLGSRGGDAEAAMTIGRIVRKFEADTIVPYECYSSCALIFIAGVSRINMGTLGLHRPYLASEPQSREKLEAAVPQMLSAIYSYVKEMRVTDRFYDLMVNTDPSEVVLLTPKKTKQIVPITDPVIDELNVSIAARKYGLTTSEMRKRDREAKACERLDRQRENACEEAIKWGLSKETYEERQAQAKSQCWFDGKNRFSPHDELAFKNTPANDRINQPFFLSWEKCVRTVMTGAGR